MKKFIEFLSIALLEGIILLAIFSCASSSSEKKMKPVLNQDSIFAVEFYNHFQNLENEISLIESEEIFSDSVYKGISLYIQIHPKKLPYHLNKMYFFGNREEMESGRIIPEPGEMIEGILYENNGEKLFLYLTFYPQYYLFPGDSLYDSRDKALSAFRARILYEYPGVSIDANYGASLGMFSFKHPSDYRFKGHEARILDAAFSDFEQSLEEYKKYFPAH